MCVDRLDEARELFEAEAADCRDSAATTTRTRRCSCTSRSSSAEPRTSRPRPPTRPSAGLRSEQRGERYQGGAALWAKALADAHLGRVEEARAAAERGTALSTEIGEEVYRVLNRFALGFLELSLGDADPADAILRLLPPRLVELGWDEPSLFPVWPNAIEALIGVGEHDLAARYLGPVRGTRRPLRLPLGARHGRPLPGTAAARRGRRRRRARSVRSGPPRTPAHARCVRALPHSPGARLRAAAGAPV